MNMGQFIAESLYMKPFILLPDGGCIGGPMNGTIKAIIKSKAKTIKETFRLFLLGIMQLTANNVYKCSQSLEPHKNQKLFKSE